MSELSNARDLLDRAERAAAAGDLVSADELLRSAARIQEAERGPLHADLANTLNNLGIIAERTGRIGFVPLTMTTRASSSFTGTENVASATSAPLAFFFGVSDTAAMGAPQAAPRTTY